MSDLFSRYRVKPSDAGHLVLLCDGQVLAQGSIDTLRLNPWYNRTNTAPDLQRPSQQLLDGEPRSIAGQ